MTEVFYGSVIEAPCQAIVNAANTQLQHGGGLALAIVKAGGVVIQKESDEIGFCPIGEAVVTSAGKLPFKFIIHVPTIDWKTRKKATLEDIYKGVVAALKIAKKRKIKKIAFPLLGAGVVGLPKKEVVKTMKKAFEEFPELEITLCAFSEKDKEVMKAIEE